MPRKIMLETDNGRALMLTETPADSEEQLQLLIKDHPELIPVEEFGMTGPVMVVGRETRLQSGAVDLVALARSGELLVIEFKTGPQNSDFRAALAQMLDYGSDLWRMSIEDFERMVALRHFRSDDCLDSRVKDKASLAEAALATWENFSEEEMEQLQQSLSRQLESGSLHYVLMAQRFTSTIETTTAYLNTIAPSANFWAVELVRFAGEGVSAFESRTVVRASHPRGQDASTPVDEDKLLQQVQDEPYRQSLQDILAACRGLGFRFYWGTVGMSIRVPVPDMTGPLTIAWFFPPEKVGWMGLKDFTLGFDETSAVNAPAAQDALTEFVKAVEQLPDAEELTARHIKGYHLSPAVLVAHKNRIVEILSRLIERVGG